MHTHPLRRSPVRWGGAAVLLLAAACGGKLASEALDVGAGSAADRAPGKTPASPDPNPPGSSREGADTAPLAPGLRIDDQRGERRAVVVQPPTDASVDDPNVRGFRFVFLTGHSLTNPTLAQADAICANEATGALPGKFKAWLSVGDASPAVRLVHSTVPYYKFPNVRVARDWAALTSGELEQPIDTSADGGPPGSQGLGSSRVLTGTNADGTQGLNCDDWTNPTGMTLIGDRAVADAGWTAQVVPCSTGARGRIYCIED